MKRALQDIGIHASAMNCRMIGVAKDGIQVDAEHQSHRIAQSFEHTVVTSCVGMANCAGLKDMTRRLAQSPLQMVAMGIATLHPFRSRGTTEVIDPIVAVIVAMAVVMVVAGLVVAMAGLVVVVLSLIHI